MTLCQNLYFDSINHRFAIYIDVFSSIQFLYWHELKKHNIHELGQNELFKASFDSTISDSPAFRGSRLEKIDLLHHHTNKLNNHRTIENRMISENELIVLLREDIITIFIKCTFSNIEQTNLSLNTLVFLECIFEDNFRITNSTVNHDLWMPNCTFKKHFSIKSTKIPGNIHMEGCNFDGLGGASFRGINAKNLYLDLGINGGNDLIWLNEMRISGIVSIGGIFNNEMQFMSNQDNNSVSYTPYIGTLLIGSEIYQYERANTTKIDSQLNLFGYTTNKILINELDVKAINFNKVNSKSIILKNISVQRDLNISGCNFIGETKSSGSLKVNESSIGRHLKINSNYFQNFLCLEGSATGEVSYIEENEFSNNAKINLSKYTSSRVLIHPESTLQSNNHWHLFMPKEFDRLIYKDGNDIGDQYCSLKHWFSDAGKLDLEDQAFYHMRQSYSKNLIKRIILGGVFGWGVRLSNIAISSFTLIIIFSAIYLYGLKLTPSASIALSIQSFISSFFGQWSGFEPSGLIATTVTIESIIGVVFITVFIGAYIRKLLR